jgi:RNA polymerase sigma factor (sigma-70 family)
MAISDREYNNCVNQYADSLYRFILKNIRHDANAQDIVQSAFEKLWINRHQTEIATIKSFLFTIAYNQMIDFIRKDKRMSYTDTMPESVMYNSAHNTHLKKALNEALYQLSDQSRSLVLLKDYEGYSYAEIGAIVNLTESQVKVYLHRARLQLRDYIKKVENLV